MPIAGNAIDNNVLTKLANRAGPVVTSAIQQASLKTGVNFAYLMEKAAAESSFDSDAGSRTSSAKGLYQFIGSTWLQMIDRYGDKYGLDKYADAIDRNGKVRDPAMRKEILALRDNPDSLRHQGERYRIDRALPRALSWCRSCV
jgi:soluble lytic murein transglycosylase-like protein